MKCNLYVLLVSAILFVGVLQGHAQELIYLKNGKIIDASIEKIDGTNIIYKNYSTGNSQKKIARKKVIMAFRQGGSCLVFRGEEKEKIFWPNHEFDKLLTRKKEVIPVSKVDLGPDFITFVRFKSEQAEKIPRNYGLAIFYRNQTHTFLAPAAEVAHGLLAAEEQSWATRKPAIANQPEASEHNLESRNLNPSHEPQPTSPATPVEFPTSNPVSVTDSDPGSGLDVSRSPDFMYEDSQELPVDMEEFKKKAVRKTEQFTRYVGRIADRRTSKYEAVKAISSAVTLFVNDTCIVEVSNVKSKQKVNLYIRKYLDRVRLYSYDRVEIQWAEINYVGNIRKGPDGNWYGTVTFLQVFSGFNDDRLVYKDVTQKRVEVKFKGYTKVIDGQSIDLWDVLLSNIAVEQTSI